jgi:hypothetical protein
MAATVADDADDADHGGGESTKERPPGGSGSHRHAARDGRLAADVAVGQAVERRRRKGTRSFFKK